MKANLFVLIILLISLFSFKKEESWAASPDLRISQVYGGGGNTDAVYQNDFIELFNTSSSPVNITGWTIQYAAATSSTWHATNLSGVINAGGYYLIQFGSGGAVGSLLPTPDAIGSTNMSASDGKVALVNNATTLSIACPSDASIIDLVGYGTMADCFEGAGAAPTLSNMESDVRASNGCIDTDDNSSDFSTGNPTPHNSSSSANPCTFEGIPFFADHSTLNVWSSPNKINIDFATMKAANALIEIYNELGQLLRREKYNGNSIYSKETSGIESAYVIVKITNEDEVIIKKLVVLNQ